MCTYESRAKLPRIPSSGLSFQDLCETFQFQSSSSIFDGFSLIPRRAMTLFTLCTSGDVTYIFHNRNFFLLNFSTSNLVVVVVTILANALIPIVVKPVT